VADRFDTPASVKGSFYAKATEELRRRLAAALPTDELRRLHERTPWKHFAWTGWQLLLLAIASAGLWRFLSPFVWIPLALVQGFTIFNFTVLLHEVVHDTVFRERNTRRNRWLGMAYAVSSGISASQFTRWHLDHHAELGSDTDDPKRFRLTPKRNRRWYKLLYFTPALFPIYFRAAAAETATYPAALRRRILLERWAAVAFHLGVAVAIGLTGGRGPLLRVHLIPVFFVFPVAFVINRLGQHYDIDPGDPAKWSSLMRPSWFWDRAFLFSNYHLEHHYYPRVPMYNLRKLHRLLQPFYRENGIVSHTYGRLLWDYLVLNRTPHTNWADRG
jgi:fatty acid desaturase